MINKEFIPYEQALVLKKLEFDGKCFGAYDKKYKLTTTTSDYWDNSSLYRLNDYFGSNTYRCLAPLYQQSFRWFREKHGIYTTGADSIFDEQCRSYFYHQIYDEKNNVLFNCDDEFDTYKEAELECLKKLIELCTILK